MQASVSDIRLPGIDGLALLTRLKQRDPSLPVVLFTGHGDIGMTVAAMRDGAYDFMESPSRRNAWSTLPSLFVGAGLLAMPGNG